MSVADETVASPRAGEELDAAAIGAFLATELPGAKGPVTIGQFAGGASNLTYLVRSEHAEWVLRRPPPGTKARTAHDMGREYRILSRIHQAFPYAPRPILYCGDAAVLGEPFYLMERLPGVVLRRELPEGLHLDEAAARRLCEELVAVHAELHRVDYAAAGLGELGHADGYVARQIRGWTTRYRAALTDDVPDNDELAQWLAGNQPPDNGRAALIHNDFKFDNVVLGERDGRLAITGVLDWEMATIGDPLMDLGASLAYWIEADDPEPLQSIRMMPTQLPGMLSRRELVASYGRASGVDLPDFRFYHVYGLFRLAVIVQQIYYRFVHGQTTNPRFASFGRFCSVLSGRALEVASGGDW